MENFPLPQLLFQGIRRFMTAFLHLIIRRPVTNIIQSKAGAGEYETIFEKLSYMG